MTRRLSLLLSVATLSAACGGPSVETLLPPFRAELQRLSTEADAADRIAVAGMDGWVFFGPELRHLGAGR